MIGCASGPLATAPALQSGSADISGLIHGGQNPVSSSVVNLYATVANATAGTAGYTSSGTAGVNLLASVTAGSDGSFSFSKATYSCPGGAYAYIQAVGGNPGLMTAPASSPIDLVAAIGPCSGLSASTNIIIDEVSTIAAAYALSGFANTAQFGIVTSATNTGGLGHAFLNAANLSNLASGTANTTTVGGGGVVPTAEINTLADILQSCVNSDPASSTACSNLYAAAKPPSATGITAPTDTWYAALDIAKYPAAAASTLFGLVPSSGAAFTPTLGSAPSDWTIGISYGGLTGVYELAIDGNDNVYVSENNSIPAIPPTASTYSASVVEFSSNGVQSSTNLNYSASSGTLSLFTDPTAMVVDKNNNLWITNGGAATAPTTKTVYGPANSNVLFELPSGNGTPVATQTTGYDDPQSLAVDSSNNIWIGNGTNTGTNLYGISELTSGGTFTTFGAAGITGKTTAGCTGLTVDKKQTVWCGTGFSYKMYRFLSPYTTATAAVSLTNDDPKQVAIDAAGNGWTAMTFYSATYPASLTEVAAPTATTQTNYNGLNGLGTTATDATWGIAIDGLGNIFYANQTANGVSEFNPFIGTTTTSGANTASGTALSESGGFTPGLGSSTGNLYSAPYQIAIDATGSLWTTNLYGTSVVQVIGTAAPTTAVQAKQNFGTLP
jgi:hypothetical protein